MLLACASFDAPIVEAHRLGGAYWPQNSRTALRESLEAGFPGIEFDLVVTGDGVPVVSHDPWLHETCVTADGEPLSERVYIQDLFYVSLVTDYLCGALPDAAFPDVEPVPEPILAYADLLAYLADAPDVLLHHDVKHQDGMTPDAGLIAAAILDVWQDADLPNPAYFDIGEPGVIRAFEAAADVDTRIAVPNFPFDDPSPVATALGSELAHAIGVEDVLGAVRETGANGAALAMQTIDRATVEELGALGYQVNVWTPNSETELAVFCGWPIASITTDAPELAPCL